MLSSVCARGKRTLGEISVSFVLKMLHVLFASCCSEEMAKTYDFALEKVGLDLASYPIYADYLAFLKQV
jgi:hypothetical protein